MKPYVWAVALLLPIVAQCAQADSVSNFQLTTIAVDVVPNPGSGDNVFFRLTGPGTNITGGGGINCGALNYWCSGDSVSLGSAFFPDIGHIFIGAFNDAMIGGKVYQGDTIALLNSPFVILALGRVILPGHPENSFSTCVSATALGPLAGFAGSGETFTQFSLSTPIGGRFCTTWHFSNTANGYQFVRGKFLVSTVPEPATLSLMASGLAGILGVSRRKRSRKMLCNP